MKIRFQADWDLNQDILTGVIRREPSVDFKTAAEADLSGVKDPDVLARAAGEGRLLVTHDGRSMPEHFRRFAVARQCPGVLIVPQDLAIREAIDELIVIWHCSEADDWVNVIDYLPL